MTSFLLRLIAAAAMLLDHTAYVLLPPGTDEYIILRSIGRLAFPIFCFLIVEGLEHTSSVPKYMGRLALFALISEIPFDLAFHKRFLEFDEGQNVFITLLLGLIAIAAADCGAPHLIRFFRPDSSSDSPKWLRAVIASPFLLLCGWLADKLDTDYGWFGVAVICIFYIFREHRFTALVLFSALNCGHYCMSFVRLDNPYTLFTYQVHGYNAISWFAPLAAVPIGLYNGEPGERRYRFWFYVFYPLHLTLLWAISVLF